MPPQPPRPQSPQPAPPDKRWAGRGWRGWRVAAWALLATLVVAVATLAAAVAWTTPQLPPLDRVTAYQPRQPLQVFTADGVEIAQFGSERRQFVPIAQIPLLLQQALLAVEDTRFREHNGIDPKGVLRALLAAATGGMGKQSAVNR